MTNESCPLPWTGLWPEQQQGGIAWHWLLSRFVAAPVALCAIVLIPASISAACLLRRWTLALTAWLCVACLATSVWVTLLFFSSALPTLITQRAWLVGALPALTALRHGLSALEAWLQVVAVMTLLTDLTRDGAHRSKARTAALICLLLFVMLCAGLPHAWASEAAILQLGCRGLRLTPVSSGNTYRWLVLRVLPLTLEHALPVLLLVALVLRATVLMCRRGHSDTQLRVKAAWAAAGSLTSSLLGRLGDVTLVVHYMLDMPVAPSSAAAVLVLRLSFGVISAALCLCVYILQEASCCHALRRRRSIETTCESFVYDGSFDKRLSSKRICNDSVEEYSLPRDCQL